MNMGSFCPRKEFHSPREAMIALDKSKKKANELYETNRAQLLSHYKNAVGSAVN